MEKDGIMENWTFTRNTGLVPVDPGMPARDDLEGDTAWLERCGFDVFGVETLAADRPGMESFAALQAAARWPYLVQLPAPGDSVALVWLPDYAAWCDFMVAYGPVFTSRILLSQVDHLVDIASKAFCAWHGHDAATFCRACDPQSYAQWQRAVQRQKALKRAANTA